MHSPIPLRLSLILFALALALVALVASAVRYESRVAAQTPPVTQQAVTVDATATFLRVTNQFDRPTLPTIIPLAASGLAPGDELRLSYEVDNFKYFGSCDPAAPNFGAASVVLLGLFSRSSQIEPAGSVLRRVPGAIDAGVDTVGPPENDIPEDFHIAPGGLTIKIPEGATHLFLGVTDSFHADNCGKVNITIERTGSQQPCSSLPAELDATSTFLRAAVTVDQPTLPTIVPLATGGFAPGDEVRLSYEVNNFKYGSFCDPAAPNVAAQGVFLLGLFSRSSQIEPAVVLRRVPGAIDAGSDYTSSPADDIPEDFRIAPGGLTIKIPEGATHLFLGVADSFYADNCGKVSVRIQRVAPQLAVPATTHGFSGDIFPLSQPFAMALSSSATGFNYFNVSPATFGGNVTEIGGLAGLQPQGLAVSTPGGNLTGISCLDSVWDFTFVIAAAGNTVGDTVAFTLQNPDGSGVLTLGVFTIEAGGARVTSLHPSARFYVNNRLADIPASGLGTFLPFSNSAGSAGARTVPLLMSLPMDPGSIFMDCRQLGFSVARSSGTGTLSLVITDVVLVRKEMAGDRDRPGVGLIFGLGGGFPTGAPCPVSCPGCL